MATHIKSWIRNLIDDPKHIHLTQEEKMRMKSYYLDSWDDGALHTVKIHFGNCKSDAEHFLYKFYLTYFNEASGHWRCRNASACCVSLAREFSWQLENVE